MLGAGTMAGMALGHHAEADAATGAQGLYDIPRFGNVSFLHMTDCHAQLNPIHFREPSVNLGVGSMKGQLPHLVGEHLLKTAGVRPGTAQAHALTYLDFEKAARRYGRVVRVAEFHGSCHPQRAVVGRTCHAYIGQIDGPGDGVIHRHRERVAAAGLHRVAHAGEEGPPAYIWEALDVLGVERIDHGVRCLEDPALVERLARDQVPLTVCPTSNVRLRVVDRMADHPLPRMLDAGLMVTVNSDDPAYFGGYVDDNYAALRHDLGMPDDALRALAANSVRASFASPGRKAELLAALGA